MTAGKFSYKKAGIFLLYLVGGLSFGELHPFSRYPMYSTFPNWAYVFYFTGQDDSLIPSRTLQVSSNELGHMYYSICSREEMPVGDNKEQKAELERAGAEMLRLVAERNKEKLPSGKTVILKRKFLSLDSCSKIHSVTATLGEAHW